MKKRFLTILMAILAALPSFGCAPAFERFEATYLDLFDTVTTITMYCKSEREFSEEAAKVYKELRRYHELFDIYNEYEGVNNIAVINRLAGNGAVAVEAPLMELLSFAKEAYAFTDGRVNIAMGAVLSIWHEYRTEGVENPESAALPPMELLLQAAEHTDIDDVVLDEESGTVRINDALLSLDVGAVAKGFAAQEVCDSARERGVLSLLISLGGNVCTVGAHPDAAPWSVGIQDSAELSQYIGRAELVSESLVTSGGYQRYYIVDGERYHHIIDPDTLMPSRYIEAVTVIADDSALCDALSTALFTMTQEDGQALIQKMGAGAVWIMNDGTIISCDIDIKPLA